MEIFCDYLKSDTCALKYLNFNNCLWKIHFFPNNILFGLEIGKKSTPRDYVRRRKNISDHWWCLPKAQEIRNLGFWFTLFWIFFLKNWSNLKILFWIRKKFWDEHIKLIMDAIAQNEETTISSLVIGIFSLFLCC